MRAAAIVCALALAACSYDYSDIPRADAGPPGADGGPGRLCDPIARPTGCVSGAFCSVWTDAPEGTRITCATTGGAGIPGDDCIGTGICRPDLICRGAPGRCETWCTDATECPMLRTCRRDIVLFTTPSGTAHPCE